MHKTKQTMHCIKEIHKQLFNTIHSLACCDAAHQNAVSGLEQLSVYLFRPAVPNLFDLMTPFENITKTLGPRRFLQL